MFASLALDVESTVCGVEGVDWLAAKRGKEMARDIGRMTEQAMCGEIPIESIYGERLARIRPTEQEVGDLARAYERKLAPGALEVLDELRGAGVRIVLISGGMRQAILPVASKLGFTHAEVFAVRVAFDGSGQYAGFDEQSPLTNSAGKGTVLHRLYLPRPVLAVGDGMTDLAMRGSADAFAAFTGYARRLPVVRGADHEVTSFAELRSLVLA